MPPQRRHPTRDQSRAQTENTIAPHQATETTEGHVQTQPLEGTSTIPPADAVPAQIQAVSHLLDILERQSRDLVQLEQSRQDMAAIAQTAAVRPGDRPPSSPPQTVVSRRHQSPPRHEETHYDTSPVCREKHRGKPWTPPSPPRSGSTNNSGNSSSDSSSSRSPSPCRKGAHKKKAGKQDH